MGGGWCGLFVLGFYDVYDLGVVVEFVVCVVVDVVCDW